MPGLQEERPPFVRFEVKEYGRDEEASNREGRHVPKFVDFAFITPFGSKDCVEKPAKEWLDQIRQKAINNLFRMDWVQMFTAQYEEWLKGNEVPREGEPIRSWSMISREQRERLHFQGITTVEDLAAVPDGGLHYIGMDGRTLRDTAKAWLAEGKDKGVNARRIADLETTVREQHEIIQRQETQLRELNAAVIAAGIGQRRPEQQPEEIEI